MDHASLEQWMNSSHLSGANAAWIEELFEQYLTDPASVSPEWQAVFSRLPDTGQQDVNHTLIRQQFRQQASAPRRGDAAAAAGQDHVKQVKVLQLINAYRFRGHQHARLDPLGLWQQPRVPDLELGFHGLSEADFRTEFNTGSSVVGQEQMQLGELVRALEQTYCGSVGVEYMHITSTEEKRWLQQRFEPIWGQPTFDNEKKKRILQGLTAAEGMERYLGTKYPGAKRFSLEGGDSLIPMLKELIHHAGEGGMREVVIGMAHRGRLNVLVNVLGKRPADLFDEFAGKQNVNGSGDVKYHMGFSSDFATKGGPVHLALAFNPSHLEIVSPVVMGSVRARLDRRGGYDSGEVLPITIHGDSAIAGQGVVQETFNLSQARAYKVGGTVRIVINNQLGFTTSNPQDTRSTQYCTDIAKMVSAPIFHVNADDPEAVVLATEIALDYRQTFKRDVVIDLVCYRRHGHNEADEPSTTQPLMYQKIKKHPTPRKLYAEQLIAEGTLKAADVEQMADEYRALLDGGDCAVPEWRPMQMHSVDWNPYLGHEWDLDTPTGIDADKLQALGEKVSTVPEHIKPHLMVRKTYESRVQMAAGDKPLDWGMAETLACASLLDEGFRVRLTGQDSRRGTFTHRQAAIHDQVTGEQYLPLEHLGEDQASLSIYDSVLSEEAVLAFEYGYATTEPRGLTLWEAQFGDFVNGAQVVIDQFLSSGEQKWGRMCGLTMLLPHGYEGQGPEHSSARLERFLQLCANHNIQICVPTTPAQVFHMLRRQVLRPMRRPLVVMTGKSLLRNPQAVSELSELTDGSFQPVLGEVDPIEPAAVRRVVLCSGKVYYDLLDARRAQAIDDIVILRIEQLYPFPELQLQDQLAQLQHVRDFVWCQEEPMNQGAWYSSQHHFRDSLPEGAKLSYAGREASASPAAGYMSLHMKQQKALVEQALAPLVPLAPAGESQESKAS